MAECSACNGTGMDVLTKEGICGECKGTGEVVQKEQDKCQERGRLSYSVFNGAYCVRCQGSGESHK